MKVGILGGSFDPPHNGHLFVAKSLLKNKLCQKVILVPCFKHPFQKSLTEAKHRLAMTKMLKDKNIEVSDIEIKRGSISYAIETLKALKAQFPQDSFVWIIGEDQIKDFEEWKGWQEIKEKFGLIVVPRSKNPPRRSPSATSEVARQRPRLLGGESQKIMVLNQEIFKPIDISSSEIRTRIKEGKDIKYLVPEGVERYIIRHKLYA